MENSRQITKEDEDKMRLIMAHANNRLISFVEICKNLYSVPKDWNEYHLRVSITENGIVTIKKQHELDE